MRGPDAWAIGTALGAEHPDTIRSTLDMALALVSAGGFGESEALACEVVETTRKKRSDLNVYKPVMLHNVQRSIELLADSSRSF